MNVKPITWTIAYRKPRANRFQRVTNWHGTWNDAYAVAREFANAFPELQVYYVPTLASENGEDAGNVLVDSGKRVRIIDNGSLSGDVLAYAVARLWDDASEENAIINEAYAGKAEDANLSIPAYLAHRKEHVKAGHVATAQLWNCCHGNERKVIVFDGGERHAVCNGCANAFTGDVENLPNGEYRECMVCGVIHIVETEKEEKAFAQIVIDSAELSIAALTPALERTKRTFEFARDTNASEATVSITYQAYCDVFRTVEEYRRTIAYATDMLS
jgi:hypothetical protein